MTDSEKIRAAITDAASFVRRVFVAVFGPVYRVYEKHFGPIIALLILPTVILTCIALKTNEQSVIIDGLFVFVLGAMVGAGELITRYRDEPYRAFQSQPGMVYLTVNGLAGLLALLFIYAMDLQFGIVKDPPAAKVIAGALEPSEFWDAKTRLRLYRVIVAGLGALLVFRSALFTIRVGDKDVAIGCYAILKQILDTVDRSVDRHRAMAREAFIEKIKDYVPLDEQQLVMLASYCFALMQNVSKEEQEALSEKLKQLLSDSFKPEDKLRLICLQLISTVGEEVLDAAVKRTIPTKVNTP